MDFYPALIEDDFNDAVTQSKSSAGLRQMEISDWTVGENWAKVKPVGIFASDFRGIRISSFCLWWLLFASPGWSRILAEVNCSSQWAYLRWSWSSSRNLFHYSLIKYLRLLYFHKNFIEQATSCLGQSLQIIHQVPSSFQNCLTQLHNSSLIHFS